MLDNKSPLGHIAALTTVLIWGFAFVVIVVLLRSFSPMEILFFRISLATLTLFIIYPRRMGKTSLRQELYFMGAGLTGCTLFFLLQDFSLLHTAASNASVLVAVAPVFVGLLSWWFLKAGCPKWTFFLGAALAIFGIALVRFAGRQLELHPLGDILAILTALCKAVYLIFLKKIDTFGYHSVQVVRRVFLYGLIFLIPVILLSDFRLGLERFVEPQNLAGMLYLSLGSSAAAFVLWNFSVTKLGPVKVSVYLYLLPLIAVTAAILFLQETITWFFVCGIVLVLAGLMLSSRKVK